MQRRAHILAYTLGSCLVLLLAATLPGCWLDRSGLLDPASRYCRPEKVLGCLPDGRLDHEYYISGECDMDEDLNGSIDTTVSVVAMGTWKGGSKQATEVIQVAGRGDAMFTMTCPDDPWLSDVECVVTAAINNTGFAPITPLDHSFYPLSAGLVAPEDLRECGGGQPPPPPPPAPPKTIDPSVGVDVARDLRPAPPTIVQPQDMSTHCGQVPLHITSMGPPTNPNQRLELEWQSFVGDSWHAANVAGWESLAQPAVNTTIPAGAFPQAGWWRVRARVFPLIGLGSVPSDWVRFQVQVGCP